MTALRGWVGDAAPGALAAWLGTTASSARCVEGHRFGVAVSGRCELWPTPEGWGAIVGVPARAEGRSGARDGPIGGLEGAFVRATVGEGGARLEADAIGGRTVFWVRAGGAVWFSTQIRDLLQIPGLTVDLDVEAVRSWLVFSFIPGSRTPVSGVSRLLPGHVLDLPEERVARWSAVQVAEEDVGLEEAARRLDVVGAAAVARRLEGRGPVGLYLSGGLDSAAVGVWLRAADAVVLPLSLDLGGADVELSEAESVARHLGYPLRRVPIDGVRLRDRLGELVWRMDMPYGDAVAAAHLLLGQAAREAGLRTVFNGEGGDQLFGGWTTRPMVSAAAYGQGYGARDVVGQYLRSFHKFLGAEDGLFGDALASAPSDPREVLAPLLAEDAAPTLVQRTRRADLEVKGRYSLAPRAVALAGGLEVAMPLLDRSMVDLAFRLPARTKLDGATDKAVLRAMLAGRVPPVVVERRKTGMSLPVTDWVEGPLREVVEDTLGPRSVRARGLLRYDGVQRLLRGEDAPAEVRRRRIGEKVWALVVLELWLRVMVDARGRRP